MAGCVPSRLATTRQQQAKEALQAQRKNIEHEDSVTCPQKQKGNQNGDDLLVGTRLLLLHGRSTSTTTALVVVVVDKTTKPAPYYTDDAAADDATTTIWYELECR